jgi:hypothetical protein
MSKKVATPQKPTMKISSGLKKKLENLKTTESGLDKASLEEVVAWLLERQDGAVGSEEPGSEESAGPGKRRKINVREPLYSLELLSEREGMLYYLTGFERSEVDLIVKRFGEVRKSLVVFSLSS